MNLVQQSLLFCVLVPWNVPVIHFKHTSLGFMKIAHLG